MSFVKFQTDMVGFNISKFVHPDDLSKLMGQFKMGPIHPFTSHTAAFPPNKEVSFPENSKFAGNKAVLMK